MRAPISGKTMYHWCRRTPDALRTSRVSSGSCPLREVKILAKIGTMNISIAMSTSVANVKTTVG